MRFLRFLLRRAGCPHRHEREDHREKGDGVGEIDDREERAFQCHIKANVAAQGVERMTDAIEGDCLVLEILNQGAFKIGILICTFGMLNTSIYKYYERRPLRYEEKT